VLKSATILHAAQKLAEEVKEITQVNLIPLHVSSVNAQDDAYFVAIKHRQGNKMSTFNILPASKAELIQLALFLGTFSFFGKIVKHQIVPGQYIVSSPNADGSVKICLSTDSDLLEVLADPSISKKLVLNLNVNQLEAYEEFITSQLDPALNSFIVSNSSKLLTTNFQLAS
jgi:hypothetical protein